MQPGFSQLRGIRLPEPIVPCGARHRRPTERSWRLYSRDLSSLPFVKREMLTLLKAGGAFRSTGTFSYFFEISSNRALTTAAVVLWRPIVFVAL